MHTTSLRLDDEIAEPALEAAKALGLSFNEFVSRAISAALSEHRLEVIAAVKADMQKYSSVLEYLGTH